MKIQQNLRSRKKQQDKLRRLVAGMLLTTLVAGCGAGTVGCQNQEAAAQDTQTAAAEQIAVQQQEQQTEPQAQQEPEQLLSAVPVVAPEDSWMTMLVNGSHPLSPEYTFEKVSINEKGYKFDVRAADALQEMVQAAREQGHRLFVCSAYRSMERQTQLFEKQVVKQQNKGLPYEEAYEKAKTVVAYPGTSEHHTGLAADIVAADYVVLEDSQADRPEQQWLMEHSWEYGFILRYQKDKMDLTGVIYEPWHYRFVGREVAQYITEEGICLEEYWQRVEAQEAAQQSATEEK